MALSPPVAADFALPAPAERAGVLDTARRALLRHPTLIAGALTLVVILVAGVLAPLWWTGDPLEMKPAFRLRPPSAERWFGSDNFGRDIYTRTLYGSRISLTVGAAVSTLSLVLGTTLGLVVGFSRRLDMIAMRVMDGLMAIPAILLALALMALMKASVQNVIIALLIPEIPRVVRLTRASVLSLREHLMVEGARALGARTPRILARYVLPGLVAPLIVQGTYIAAHSFLGQHHGGRPRLRSARLLDHPLPGHLPGRHGARDQSRGRWATRSPGRALESWRP